VHIPDGWVDLPTSAAAGGVAVAATGTAFRRASAAFRERVTTLPAVIAAYLLVAQLLVIPVGLGTSAHLIGTGLATLLVGPEVAIICVAAVVVVQALLLADGGVTAIGLNIINDGLTPALVTWGLYRLVRPIARSARSQAVLGGSVAGVASLAAAGTAAAAFAIGGTHVVPPLTVATAIGGAHLGIAVIEAVLTAAILRTVLHLRPDLVRATRTSTARDDTRSSSDAPMVHQ
jgi:cobalt/nickel transport system permease protein